MSLTIFLYLLLYFIFYYQTIAMGMSGGFAPFSAMVKAVRWLQWISPFKYSLQAMMIGYTGKENPVVVEMLELDKPSTASGNTCVLYLMFLILSVLSVVILKRKREVR
jgi:hypothetical protein